MTWRRVLLGLVLLITALVVLAWFWGLPWLVELGRQRLEGVLAQATDQDVSIRGLHLDILQTTAHLDQLTIGKPESPSLQLSDVDLRVRAGESLTRRQPVVSGHLGNLIVDATRWPAGEQKPEEKPEEGIESILPLPSIDVSSFDVGHLKVVLPGEEPMTIEAPGAELTAQTQAGRAIVELHSEAIDVSLGPRQVRVQKLALQGGVDQKGLVVDKLTLRSDLGSIDAKSTAPHLDAVDADVALGKVADLLGLQAPVAGQLSVSGTLRGDLLEPRVQAKVAVRDWRYDDYRGTLLAGNLDYGDKHLQVSDLDVRGEGLQLAGNAALTIEGAYPFDAKVQVSGIDLAALGPRLGVANLEGSGSAELTAAGTISPFAVEQGNFDAALQGVRRASYAGSGLEVAAHAEASLAGGSGSADASVRLNGAEAIQAKVQVGANQSLDGHVEISVPNTAVLRPLEPTLQGGSVRLTAAIGGTTSSPAISGDIAANGVVVQGVRIDAVSGGFEATEKDLVAKQIEVRAVGGRAAVNGRVALQNGAENSWQVDVQNVDLEAMWTVANGLGLDLPYMSGELTAQASAQGEWSNLQLSGQLNGKPLALATERFSSVHADVEVTGKSWKVDAQIQHREGETLTLEGHGTGTEQVSLQAQSMPWALDGFGFIQKMGQNLEGTAVVQANITGSLRQPAGEAQVILQDVKVENRDIGQVTAKAQSVPQGWSLHIGTPSQKLVADGTVRSAAGYPYDFEVILDTVDLGPALSPEADLAVRTSGTLTAKGRLSEPTASLDMELRLPQLEISRSGLALSAQQPVVITGHKGRFDIGSLQLGGALGRLQASGYVELGGPMQVNVTADTDAAILELAGQVITSARGHLNVDANIRRSGGAWSLSGGGNLQNLAIDFGLPFGVTDANGSFQLHQNQIEVTGIQGKLGGGDFSVQGGVDMATGPDLSWQFVDISTGFLEDLEDRLSGTGKVTGSWSNLTVDGQITILSAVYSRDIGLQDLMPSLRRQVQRVGRPTQKGGTTVRLNLHVVATDGVYVDTPVATAEFRVDLRVLGTAAAPRLDGRVELLSGQVVVGREQLELIEGTIDFNNQPQINPDLHFTATATVQTAETDYDVTAQVVGTMQNFRVVLSSDDANLTQTDVFALLTLGKTSAQLQRAGGGAAAADILSLAPSLYGRQLSRDITQVLPVDRLQIEPTFSPTTGSFEPRLTIGKDITEQLSATVGSTFGAETRNSAGLEYQLTPSISVQGQWKSQTESQAGTFGGDIKFRHRFRHLPCLSVVGLCPGDVK